MYKVSPITHWIAKNLVKIKHISLVNILSGKTVVPEFIQDEACRENVLPVALDLLEETAPRQTMLRQLRELKTELGETGASDRAAEQIVQVLGRSEHG